MSNAMTATLPDGTAHRIERLLTKGDRNVKLRKGMKKGYLTCGLPLAPANVSGYQVCPHATPGCKAACIFTSGHAMIFPLINRGRVARTRAWFEQRDEFKAQLLKEVAAAVRKAKRERKSLAIRLNVFSDIPWESQFPEVFEQFPNVQFYDYTKNPRRAMKWAEGQMPANYHLTFSRSEKNEAECLAVLAKGGNVTVVFECGINNRWKKNLRPIPTEWKGFKVINGDETDLRFLDGKGDDGKGVVVGLFAKHTRGRDKGVTSGFIVRN